MASLEGSDEPEVAAKKDSSKDHEPSKKDEVSAASSSGLQPVITKEEIVHFYELGLGRGVDSTDPRMWKSKSPFQVRKISKNLENVVGTNENGIKNKYTKAVSSLKTQQSKIQLSLSVPSSQVNIGLDAHYSQSTSSTVTIAGEKVNTRTIAFRHGFEDLPVSDSEIDDEMFAREKVEGLQTFENDFATWILANLDGKQKHGVIPAEPRIDKLNGHSAIEKLDDYARHITDASSPEAKAVEIACRTFIFELGVTHYVSAIELGAMKFSVQSSKSVTRSGGIGKSIKGGSVGSASGGADFSSEVSFKTFEEQYIGSFNEETGEVRRNTSDEAVIGFQIRPVSKLIRLESVQLAMTVALDMYIKSKTEHTMGPYLISTTINKKPIFWKVDQTDGSIRGTEEIKESSLFYLVPEGDKFSPTEFTILHWGDQISDRRILTNVSNPICKLRTLIPKAPRTVTSSSTFLGPRNGPLLLKDAFDYRDGQFALYSRINRSRLDRTRNSTAVGVNVWMEGEELYIKHQGHSVRSFYVTMQRNQRQQNTYTTTVLKRVNNSDPNILGVLFRIHPYQLRSPAVRNLEQHTNLDTLPLLAGHAADTSL